MIGRKSPRQHHTMPNRLGYSTTYRRCHIQGVPWKCAEMSLFGQRRFSTVGQSFVVKSGGYACNSGCGSASLSSHLDGPSHNCSNISCEHQDSPCPSHVAHSPTIVPLEALPRFGLAETSCRLNLALACSGVRAPQTRNALAIAEILEQVP